MVNHISSSRLDHRHVQYMLKYKVQSNTRRDFCPIRFELAWACEESCDTRMENAWLITVEEGDMLGLKKKLTL